MFGSRKLLGFTLITLLFSCHNPDKQKEQVSSEIKSGTTAVVEKDPGASIIERTQKAITVAANSNFQLPSSLETDLKTIEPGYQNFVIGGNADTTIIASEGTVFRIKHSSFLRVSDSTEVKGTITFQVKEFYKTSDILSARLSTHADSNILETGGMLFIQATANGQLCKLKAGSAIEISFPFTEKKDSMLLFSGNWVNKKIDWELFPPGEAGQKEIVDELAAYPGDHDALNRFIRKNLVYPDSLADMGIGGVVRMNFVIDETGTVKDVNFKYRSQKGFRDAIMKTFSKMPKWKPAKRNGIPVKSTYSQSIIFQNLEQDINDTNFKNDFEATFNDTNINKAESADIQQYIFSTSKLGWINCDRFYNDPKPKTDFYVDCGRYTALDIKLVFHSFRAVLDNCAIDKIIKFQNIPDGEAITVVVIKKINNDTFISLMESNTSLRSISNLAFEKVTMETLKQKLEQLNNVR